MDKRFNELNEFLDAAINDVLQDTTDRYSMGVDNKVDESKWRESDRFKGFDSGARTDRDEDPPPYKIYERPLTADEVRRYREYETSRKEGKSPPVSWEPDASILGEDKTEMYRKQKNAQDQSIDNTSRSSRAESDDHQGQSTASQKPQYKFYRPSDKNDITPKPESFMTYKDFIQAEESKPDINQKYTTYKDFIRPEETKPDTSIRYSDYKDIIKSRETKPDSQKYTTSKDFYSPEKINYKPARSIPFRGLPEKPETLRPQYHTPQHSTSREDPSNRTTAESDSNLERYGDLKKSESIQSNTAQDKLAVKDGNTRLPEERAEEVKEELLKLRPPIKNRASWGALPTLGKLDQMIPPADTVIFTFNTDTPPCLSEKECKRTVREIQAKHMGEGLADIQYNFLVGGDGNLYEGRGWGFESGVKPEGLEGKNYNIAFIGRYKDDVESIPQQMLSPVQDLIVWGNAIRLINKSAKAIGEYKEGKNN